MTPQRMAGDVRVPLWRGAGATVALAVPLMVAQMAVVALSLVDTVTFSHLGAGALGGGALATAVFSLVHIICVGVVLGVGNEIAFCHGAGDADGIRRAMRDGRLLAIGLALLAAVLVMLAPWALEAMGQAPEAVDLAAYYLMGSALAFLPSLLFVCDRGLVTAMGHGAPVSAITVLGLVAKLVLNVVLVMGVAPDSVAVAMALCGLANVCCYALMAVAMRLWCRRRLATHLLPPAAAGPAAGSAAGQGSGLPPDARAGAATERSSWRQRRAGVHSLFRLGWPIGFTYGVEAGLFSATALLVGQYGEGALAAHQIANQCVYLTFMLAVGLSHAASVRTGVAAGAGNLREARRLGHQALVIGLGVMTFNALLYGRYGSVLVGWLYAPSDGQGEAIAQLATQMLWVAACFQWFDGTQAIAMGAIRGLKRTRMALLAGVVGYWLVGLPAGWWLGQAMDLGPLGPWWGVTVGLGTTALILLVCFQWVTRTPAARVAAAAGGDPASHGGPPPGDKRTRSV